MLRKFTKYPKSYVRADYEYSDDLLFDDVTVIEKEQYRGSDIRFADLTDVVRVGVCAFRDCENLISVKLNPYGVELGALAFANCKNLKEVVITPDTVISAGTFSGCENLTVIWETDDCNYKFYDRNSSIDLLVCPRSCKQLIAANKDYVDIELLD